MCDGQLRLEMLVNQAHDELHRIGSSLISDGCIEIWNLISDIDDIKISALIENSGTAFGGFCSQSGRLAGVMATMSKIGGIACEAAKREGYLSIQKLTDHTQMGAIMESPVREDLLKSQLRSYVEEFNRLGTQLQRLTETDIVFIVCDARVLHDHPDLCDYDMIRCHFSAATEHLEALSVSLWSLAEESKEKARAYEAVLDAHMSRHKIH